MNSFFSSGFSNLDVLSFQIIEFCVSRKVAFEEDTNINVSGCLWQICQGEI
jgi:hypothetical protein